MPFELTDTHTCADIGLIATGNSLIELFSDSAFGLTSVMVELNDVSDSRIIPIEIYGDDLENLFYHWLSEIIYLKDAEHFLLKNCVIELDEQNFVIKGKLTGDTIDSNRHILKIDVKAVTYYKFKVEKIGLVWRGEVVFDL
jgi:SHS2 domain-containing protein